MKSIISVVLVILFLSSCQEDVVKYGKHYQEFNDISSLMIATELIPEESDTTYVRKILGEPTVRFSTDYRYLTDSIGENNCIVGAVFGITDYSEKISWKGVLEICE